MTVVTLKGYNVNGAYGELSTVMRSRSRCDGGVNGDGDDMMRW